MDLKQDALHKYLKDKRRIAVALSGGLDSSALLAVSADILGAENCLALTAATPYMMKRELAGAAKLASRLGVRHIEIEGGIPLAITNNPPERCYLCKLDVFSKIIEAAGELGFGSLADGTNSDDTADYRPGMKALKELGVLSPFLECGIGKLQIRELARHYNLDVAESPAYACLLTRLEHDVPIDISLLSKIDSAENFLAGMGFLGVRVRINGECARIEAQQSQMEQLFGAREKVSAHFKKLGFKYTAIDLNGYIRGSMNKPVL